MTAWGEEIVSAQQLGSSTSSDEMGDGVGGALGWLARWAALQFGA